MQYLIPSSSILAGAVRHALVDICGVPTAEITVSEEPAAPFGVQVNGQTYKGLLAMLHALRTVAVTAEQKEFLGCTGVAVPLVNQWVGVASILSVDATRTAIDAANSVAKTIYGDVEKQLAMMDGSTSSFLTGSSRATIADVLFFAAAHSHPSHTEVLPITMSWSIHAQNDAYLSSIASDAVKAAAASQSKSKDASKQTYVKPSEAEILRRRQEKENAKREKAAAAGTSSTGGDTGKSQNKAAETKHQDPTRKSTAKGSAAGNSKTQLGSDSLDIRVGRLTNLRRHPDADRLYVEEMNLGEETRVIVSGLVEHYSVEELEGTTCLVVYNMKPKALKGINSQGMVLCASNETQVRLVRPPADAKPGDRVRFGASASPATDTPPVPAAAEPLSGNKMTEVLSHLHTNGDGILCWKDEIAYHATAGVISIPEMKNCVVK